jgi:segregation and condensation protein B
MAGELTQEEIPLEETKAEAPVHHAPESVDELEAQRHTHLPQADGSPYPTDDPLDDPLPDDELLEESGETESKIEVAETPKEEEVAKTSQE